ncbi:MAG: AAA family ATPase [Candidatus Aenigmarchaeota archaeon]|nr:AAA family ATPase [Candidatus Aenigmarchaeota archaeon]
MKSEMNLSESYMEMFNWDENPFSFKIMPNLFVGYMDETDVLYSGIKNNDKISLLVGPTGAGKTTLLKFLIEKIKNDRIAFYLSKPPNDPDDWVKIFTNFIKPSFIERLFSRSNKINIYNLSEWVNKKMKDKSIVILIDESHETNVNTLEWLRTFADQIDNLSVVITGLPVLEKILKDNLETFMRRVNTRVELSNLTKSETRELIKKRIEHVGGDDIKPFTSESINHVYEKTGGFPREIIRVCNELVKKAIRSNISTIDTSFLNEYDVGTKPKRASLGDVKTLPSKQSGIIEILGKYGECTPSEIVSKIDLGVYKNKDNAVRSINNILKRLVKDEMVIRKRKGKSYQYLLSDKMKIMMVDT